MRKESSNTGPTISQAIYDWLLLAYPRGHREAYGPAMRQLFRDQYRDAWNESRSWGVTKLWLNILPDLVSSSIIERLASFRERKSMSDKLTNLSNMRGNSPLTTFSVAFTVVFLIVFIGTAVVTYILPETYASTARMKIAPDEVVNNGMISEKENSYDPYFIQTTFEIIQSQMVLDGVIGQLDLNHVWGKKFNKGQPLLMMESRELLKNCIALSPVRDTQLVAVTAYSQDKLEAAKIANGVVAAYQEYRANGSQQRQSETLDSLNTAYISEEQTIQEKQGQLDQLSEKAGLAGNTKSRDEVLGSLEGLRSDQEQTYLARKNQLDELTDLQMTELRQMLPTIMPDPTLNTLLDQLAEAERQYALLTVDSSTNEASVMRVQSQVKILNQQADDRLAGIMAGLKAQTQAQGDAVAKLNDQIVVIKSANDYWATKSELEHLMQVHALLYTKIESEKLDIEIPKTPVVEIVDQAEPAMFPVKPNKTLNIFIGGMLGVIAGSFAGGLAVMVVSGRRKTVGTVK